MDPITAAAGAASGGDMAMWVNAGSSVLSSMMADGGAPPNVSNAAQDGSHWTVATGGSRAAADGGGIPWWVWGGAIALVAVWIVRGQQ